MPDQEQRQRETAYFLWQEAGRPDGMDLAFWYAAQRRKPAAHTGRDDPDLSDFGRDDVSRPPTGPATASPVAKKKKRPKR